MSTRQTVPLSLLFLWAVSLSACNPYPDADDDFLAGVAFSDNFLPGVKSLAITTAAGRGLPQGAYQVISTTGTSATRAASSTPATSPLWTDSLTPQRDPLAVANAQDVFVFDKSPACTPTDTAPFDPFMDLIHKDRQYPVFNDLPELLTRNSGKPGRIGTGSYSAIVRVRHVSSTSSLPCQSIKRFDTVTGRLGSDLKEATTTEFRLLQIIDPGQTAPSVPFQRGFYNQLLVAYIDMGPVPVSGDKFAAMPVYRFVNLTGKPLTDPKGAAISTPPVVFGAPDEAGAAYSPVCRNFFLPVPQDAATGTPLLPPLDATDSAYAKASSDGALSTCIVCRVGSPCPFSSSLGGAR